MSERFLVTGALGCIGAWTCSVLAAEGTPVVGFDLGTNDSRLRLAGAEGVPIVRGDITDRDLIDALLDEHEITHVIHLAALLIPQIKANPPYGTAVNIGGHRQRARCGEDAWCPRRLRELCCRVLAGRRRRRAGGKRRVGHPTTFYGVHKQACEGLARIYWQEEGVPSIGIRPFIVYGPGRDSGLTASPSLAMAAAARGEDAQIAFGGRTQLQFAPDTARAFVAAARAATEDARVFNLGGPVASLAEAAAAIEAEAGVHVDVDERTTLPFPEAFDGAELEQALGGISWTPLRAGVAQTIDRLRAAQG